MCDTTSRRPSTVRESGWKPWLYERARYRLAGARRSRAHDCQIDRLTRGRSRPIPKDEEQFTDPWSAVLGFDTAPEPMPDRLTPVPDPSASWWHITEIAMTYDG